MIIEGEEGKGEAIESIHDLRRESLPYMGESDILEGRIPWMEVVTRHVPRLADEFVSLDVGHKLYKALHNNPCRLVTPTGMM
jgi:hypothetical protein